MMTIKKIIVMLKKDLMYAIFAPQKDVVGEVHKMHLCLQGLTLNTLIPPFQLNRKSSDGSDTPTGPTFKCLRSTLCVSVDSTPSCAQTLCCSRGHAPPREMPMPTRAEFKHGGPTSWRLHHSCEHIRLDSVSGSPGFSWLYCFHPSRPITSPQLNKQGHRRGRAALGGCGVQKVSALLCCQQITIKIKMPERDGWSSAEPLCCCSSSSNVQTSLWESINRICANKSTTNFKKINKSQTRTIHFHFPFHAVE